MRQSRTSSSGTRLTVWVIGLVVGATLIGVWLLRLRTSTDSDVAPQSIVVTSDSQSPEHRLAAAPEPEAAERVALVQEESAGTAAAARQTASLLRGCVRREDGRPAPHVLVGLVQMANGEPARSARTLTTKTDARGEYELEPPAWSLDREVLLLAREPGRRPASRPLVLRAEVLEQVHELRLEAGFEISGRVINGAVGASEVHLSLDLRYGVPGVFGAGAEAFWIDGRLEEKLLSAITDEGGYFRFTGLGPHEHRLHSGTPPGLRRLVSEVRRQVQAPDQSLVIDLSVAELAIEVTNESGVVADANVQVESDSHRTHFRSEVQPVLLGVEPWSEVVLSVEHGTSADARHQLTAPAAGQRMPVTVALQTIERPGLQVLLPGAREARIERIHLRVLPHAGDREARELDVVRTPSTDLFELAVLPLNAGRYSFVLEPPDSGVTRYMTPCVVQCEVPEVGRVDLAFELTFGGRCEVEINSSTKRQLQASYRLIDAEGQAWMPRRFFRSAQDDEDQWGMEFSRDSFVDNFEPTPSLDRRRVRNAGILPAGQYELRVDAGEHEPFSTSVVIEVGETTRVEVQLQPKEEL